jgi:hypothetical protein
MNEIRVRRLVLAGFVTFIVWIAAEIVIEQVIGRALFGNLIERQWLAMTRVGDWTAANHVLNIVIALVNTTLMIWLYASLRPMYGVGVRTALITSIFGIVIGFSLAVNGINLGLFPAQAVLVEAVYEAFEYPIALIAGASVYEGRAAWSGVVTQQER